MLSPASLIGMVAARLLTIDRDKGSSLSPEVCPPHRKNIHACRDGQVGASCNCAIVQLPPPRARGQLAAMTARGS